MIIISELQDGSQCFDREGTVERTAFTKKL
jgi:hypothetical protein